MQEPNYRRFQIHPQRPLYLMAKPGPELARMIWSHPRTDRRRPAHLLHITVLPLMNLALFPPGTVDCLRRIMGRFEAAPFRVVFDLVAERHVVALRGSERIRGAQAFQRKLVTFLGSIGFRYFGEPPEPHLTLSYRRDDLGATPIDPISWMVKELLLVESVFGETRHVVHDRWTLRHQAREALPNTPFRHVEAGQLTCSTARLPAGSGFRISPSAVAGSSQRAHSAGGSTTIERL